MSLFFPFAQQLSPLGVSFELNRSSAQITRSIIQFTHARATPAAPQTMADHLPSELLLMVWLHLGQNDLVRVSQTCRRWRTLALGCPRLWAHVEFFCPESEGVSNLSLVRELLPRSRQLPLSVQIRIPGPPKPYILPQFCALLEAESNRLETLHIHSLSSGLLSILLAQFEHLPALCRLTLTTPEMQFVVVPFMERRIEMPVLDHLHLDAGLTWPRSRHVYPAAAHLRNLRNICMTPPDAQCVVRVLDGCPNLELMDLRMHFFAHGDNPELMLSQSARFPAVRISRVEFIPESLVMEIMENPGFRDVFVDLDNRSYDPSRLFSAVTGPADVSLRSHRYALEFEASDSSGHRRGMMFHPKHLVIAHGLGPCIPCSSIARATVDFAAWPCFISHADCFANLSHLTVRMRITTSPSGEQTHVASRSSLFPALQTLRIKPAEDVLGTTADAFVDSLLLSHRLRTLSLPRHSYAQSPDKFDRISESVEVL